MPIEFVRVTVSRRGERGYGVVEHEIALDLACSRGRTVHRIKTSPKAAVATSFGVLGPPYNILEPPLPHIIFTLRRARARLLASLNDLIIIHHRRYPFVVHCNVTSSIQMIIKTATRKYNWNEPEGCALHEVLRTIVRWLQCWCIFFNTFFKSIIVVGRFLIFVGIISAGQCMARRVLFSDTVQ